VIAGSGHCPGKRRRNVRLDINEVVNEVLSLIRREIANHQVTVRLDLAAPTDSTSLPPIFGDRSSYNR